MLKKSLLCCNGNKMTVSIEIREVEITFNFDNNTLCIITIWNILCIIKTDGKIHKKHRKFCKENKIERKEYTFLICVIRAPTLHIVQRVLIEQFVVTNCRNEWPGSIVTETLKDRILIPIATSKELQFNADFQYISLIKFSLTHQKLQAWENLPYFRK